MPPPLGDIAHIGHVELLTPDAERSVRSFTEILGLTENGRSGGSAYLCTFDDYEHHSLVLTASAMPGVRRTSLRASSEEALLRRVAATKEAGLGGRWTEDEPGIGPMYLTTDKDGHELALSHETEWYQAPPEPRPGLKNQPQAKPRQGVGVRRLDHVNTGPGSTGGCTPSRSPPTPARTSSGRPTSAWTTTSSSGPARTSTPSGRRSSCTSTRPEATGSSCATR
jgi:catechol 2,3-dioxygenase